MQGSEIVESCSTSASHAGFRICTVLHGSDLSKIKARQWEEVHGPPDLAQEPKVSQPCYKENEKVPWFCKRIF